MATGQDRAPSEATQSKGQETRDGLLAAAEHILIDEGMHMFTVRRIGAVSGLAPTLVTYHFGTTGKLLSELCELNLQPILDDWKAPSLRDGEPEDYPLEVILRDWLGALMRPAAFVPHGRALLVLDEIAAHGDREFRALILGEMFGMSQHLQQRLIPFTPHLDARERRARIRFISGGALGPPPRARTMVPEPGEKPLDGLEYLVNFAMAALAPTDR